MISFPYKQQETGPATFDLALQSFRVVFMGTPDFAVASLDALVRSGCNVVGVITAPDKPAGRGMKLTQSAVKKYATEHGLNILQPEKLRDPGFLDTLRALNADLQVVVAFRMLPEIVWSMPPKGTINVHGSLLPRYRGAAPINWAVINGDTETGVTTFKLQHAIDTGNILMQDKFPIGENETAGEVHDRMMNIGAQLLVRTIKGLKDGSLQEIPQSSVSDPATLPHAPKIFTETCHIHFDRPVAEVHNLIRGLSPFPGAFTHLDGKLFKIYKSEKEAGTPDVTPGQFQTDGKTFLKFACNDGWLVVKELQLEGKKRMGTEDFLRGHKFAI
jgi:methionyl-tRNA formyltransferase